MAILQKVRHEVSQVLSVTLFFAVSFVSIGVIKMLFLAEYGVQFSSVAKALVGALVVGKVVVVLDATSFGDRFRNHALWLDVLYKALVYTTLCACVLSLERIIHELSEAGSWMGAVGLALESTEIHRFLGTTFCLFLVFIGYALMTALSEHFGRGVLLGFLLSADKRRESRESLQGRS